MTPFRNGLVASPGISLQESKATQEEAHDRCSTSLIVMGTPNQSPSEVPLPPIRVAAIKTPTKPECGDGGKSEPSCAVAGRKNGAAAAESRVLKRGLPTRVPSSTTHNRHKGEAALGSLSRGMDERQVVNAYEGILFSLLRKRILCNVLNMN